MKEKAGDTFLTQTDGDEPKNDMNIEDIFEILTR
jgi:hypothetical protein